MTHPSKRRPFVTSLADHRRRALWFVLFLMHLWFVPAAWTACASSHPSTVIDSLFRFALLVGAIGLFVTKLVDPNWLRIKPGWHPATCAVCLVAIGHLSVIQRHVRMDLPDPPAQLGAVCLLGSAAATRVTERITALARYIRSLAAAADDRVQAQTTRLVGTLAPSASGLYLHEARCATAMWRAPPRARASV